MRARHLSTLASAAVWVWLIAAASPLRADVTPGQIDDFDDGTTSGWQHGLPNPDAPRVVEDGGPTGAGDAYLEVSSNGGFGAGSKLIMFNDQDHWTGSYLGPGAQSVVALAVDLNNLSEEPLTMWFTMDGLYETEEGEEVFASVFTDKFELAPQSGWQHAVFSLDPSDLTSDGDPLKILDNVTRIWLFHNESDPFHPAPSLAAVLGMDNLRAVGPVVNLPGGDFNGNGLVEQEDLDLVLANWGQDASNPPANWVFDLPTGNIDQTELDKVLANWGVSVGALGSSAAVPEPSAWILLAVAGCLLGCRIARS